MKRDLQLIALKWGLNPGRVEDYVLEMRKDIGMLEVAREQIISENVSGEAIRPENLDVSHQVRGESWEDLMDYPVDTIARKISEAKSDFRKLMRTVEKPQQGDLPENHEEVNLRLVMREWNRDTELPEAVRSTVEGEEGLREKWGEAESISEVREEFIDMIYEFRIYSDQDYGDVMDIWEPNIPADEKHRIIERIKKEAIDLLEDVPVEEAESIWNDVQQQTDESRTLVGEVGNPAAVHETLTNYILGGNPAKMPVRIGGSGMEYGNSIMAPLQTVEDSFWPKALDTTVHEYGHTFGRQNLSHEHVFLPLGEPPSEAIDEGTARFYQCHVFRSRAFLSDFLDEEAQEWLRYHGVPEFDGKTLYRWFNAIDPENRERISADPITYPLHVVIRYEIEKELVESNEPVELMLDSLHDKWQNKMQSYIGDPLGIKIEEMNESDTVLQDVHWGKGKFGYFPSYILGDVIAANWRKAMDEELEKDVREYASNADLDPVNEWMVENIWQHGKAVWDRSGYTELDVDPYLDHLRSKSDELYG